MNIWLINHYAVPTMYYPLARQTYFAKHLQKKGHTVTIISASTVHNSDINLLPKGTLWKKEHVEGVDHIYIRCQNCKGNGIKRILNMTEFAIKLPFVCGKLNTPDAIVATSMPPMSCAVGIKLAKKYHCVGIAEIADLWPESIIAYGIAGPKNPAVLALRRLEKWIYKQASAIVFTMGGGYDYICDQHWENEIPKEKVYFINNGIDLETYNKNTVDWAFPDEDLDDDNTFKIVYTGSLRKANQQIFSLFEAIKLMQDEEYKDYRFLIYGKGDYEQQLRDLCENNCFENVRIKGFVEKKYIPYILSKCDLNILNCTEESVLKYGGSQNKLFDYLASGHPIVSGESNEYSIIRNEKCGIAQHFDNAKEIVDTIKYLKENPISENHIKSVANKYDYYVLSEKLETIINDSPEIG